MYLQEKLKALYPELEEKDFVQTIVIQNDQDGKGDYIVFWSHPEFARPTQEQLDAIN